MSKPLKFQSHKFIRLTFDQEIRRAMRELWLRKRMISGNVQDLEGYYMLALSLYLEKNRIPKQIRRRIRTQARLLVSELTASLFKDIEKIARSRQQPFAVILEECLEQFLELPENYLGKDKKRKEYRELLTIVKPKEKK